MNLPSLPASLWHRAVENYRTWLVQQGLSQKTVENYVSDLRRWLTWLNERPGLLAKDLTASAESYLEDLATSNPPSTVNRRTAALRRFADFLIQTPNQGWNLDQQLFGGTPQRPSVWSQWIDRFAVALSQNGCNDHQLQNYLDDVGLFLSRFPKQDLEETLTKYEVAKYLRELRQKGANANNLVETRKSLQKFAAWATEAGFFLENPLGSWFQRVLQATQFSTVLPKRLNQAKLSVLPAWKRWYLAYHRLPFTTALHLSILVVFASMLSVFAFRQFGSEVQTPFAYPSTAVRPNRQLSFQGRLTDSVGTPITTATNVSFTLHDAVSAGNQLWDSGTCSIDPDQDGIFSTALGDTCGTEIPEDVFSELANVWLEIEVGGETLTPRQQISSVPYALNTETVQGFPISLSGNINTIPVVNALGEIIIGASNPSIIASSGAFLVQGESLTLATEAGGDITLNAGTGGTVEILDTTNITGGLSASGTVTFSGLADGLVRSTSGVLSGGNTIALTSDVSGVLPIANGGTNTNTLGSAGTIAYSTGTAYAFSAVGTTGQCLVSNGSSAPSWSTCLTSVSEYWNINNGALYPTNQTTDVLLGGNATSSARIAFLNVLTGTPTASLSAGVAGGTYFTAGGAVSTTARQNLLLGNSSAANTTGNILLQSNGTGRVGIGTATPGELLSIYDGRIEFIGNNTMAGVVLSNANYDFRIANTVSTADIKLWPYLDDVYFENTYSGAMIFRNDTDGTPDELFRVTAGGNFGIGDSTPASMFTVGNGDLFEVSSAGEITDVRGITNTGSVTTTGGAVNINASSNFATNINTGSNNAALALGGGSGTVAINSTSWDISTAGAATGFTGITSSGTITFSGLADGLVRSTSGVLSGGNTVALTSDVSGVLPIANGGTNSTATPTAGTIAYGTGTAYAFSAVGTTGQCLVSNGSSAPSWSTCLTSVSEYWNINAGALSPTNQTTDLLVGGAASASAKFAVLNVLTGTPTASVSAGATGATYLTASGTLQTTANQNLTIGGNTTGDITLSPLNGSGRVNSTGDLNLSSGKAYLINGTSVLNATTLGSGVTTSSLTTVGALSSGSIASGFGTIATANTITGTTLNGTTGINTGAGAGTQRLDNSGNLVNIGNITATGTLQNTGATTLSGGVVNINDASNFATNINTGSSNGAVTIGGGSGTVAINSTSWDISTAGAASGFTGITSSGTITFSGLADGLVRSTSGVLSGGNTVALTSEVSGVLPIANGGTNSTATPTQGGVAYGTGTAYAFTAAGSSGECFKSNGTSAPTWGSCTTGVTEYWSIAAGALRPLNSTTDLLVGGTATASAKFGLINVNSGTPTLLITDVTNTTTLTATGTLYRDGNITLDANSGADNVNVVGDLNISSGNAYQINGTSVLNATTLGSGVTTSSLTTVGALSSGSIASGFGTIATANTITGTTLNGTTGINTGAGAGTQRLDNSGNLVNIGNITASGTITFSGLASGVVKANGSGVLSGGNTVVLTSDVSGVLPIANGGTNSTATPTAGTIAYGTGTAYAFSAVGTTGQCLVSNGALAPSWSTCLTSVSEYWNINAGALSPTNQTTDVLIGGPATASAKFAFLNVSAGSPTASISAGATGALTLNSNGTIGTTAGQNLTLGNATTGNIALAPAGSNAVTILQNGNVGIGDTNPSLALNVHRSGQSDIAISTNTNVGAGNATVLSFISDADGTPSYSAIGQYSTGDLRFSGAANLVTPDAILTTGGSFGIGGDLTPNSMFSVGSTSQFQVNSSGAIAAATGITSSGTITFSGLSNGLVRSTSGVLSGAGTVSLTTEVTGTLPIANGGTNTTATPTQGGVAYGTGTAYAFTAAGTSGQCFLSNGTSAPTWGSCLAGITDYWSIANGALYDINRTTDFLIGSTSTASAKFAVLNVNSGTPTASVSAGAAGATYITAAGTIQTTANQNMTIGGATTGNLFLKPLNGNGQVRVPEGSVIAGNKPGLAFNLYDDTGIAVNHENIAIWESGTIALNLTNTLKEFRVPSDYTYAFASSTNNNTGADTSFSRFAAGFLRTPGSFLVGSNLGIGDTSPASALTVGSGDLFEVNSSGTITDVRGITNTGAITSSGGAISLNASSNFAVDIATGTSTGTVTLGGTGTQTISLGTGAGIKTVNVGSNTSSSATTIMAGSGGLGINDNINSATNINTGLSNGAVSIAGGNATVAINSTTWDISTAGVASGFTGLTSSGTITLSGLNVAGGVVYTNGSGVLSSVAGSSGQCLQSNGSSAPSWGSCLSGLTDEWSISNGALLPNNLTTDMLVGGNSSESAKFAVLNVNSGTPTASVSAGTAGAAYLSATGTLGTTAGQDLSFAPSGSTQAVITNGGRLGVGTTAPSAKVHALATTEQLRLGYDATNYAQFTVQSNGDLNINSVASSGTPKISLADNVQLATGNVLDVSGDVRFTFGTDLMSVNEQLRVTYDPSNYTSLITNSTGNLTIDPTGTYVLIDAATLSTTGDIELSSSIQFTDAGSIDTSGPLSINAATDGMLGVGTSNPNGALEINHSTGNNLRLTYNDSNGSATNYTDFLMSSGGDLTIDPSGGDLTLDGNISVSSGSSYQINGTSVLNATTLGSGVTASSLTSVGTLTGLTVSGTVNLNGNTTLGDASGDTVTVNAASWTFANDTNLSLTGGVNGLSLDGTTFSVDSTNDRIGIGTSAPDRALEINHASGQNLRLTYNDSNGSATNYVNFDLSSIGELQIDTTGNTIYFNDNLTLSSGFTYQINGTSVLSSTTLGSSVVTSSLTTIGTLTGLTVNGTTTINSNNSSNTTIGGGTSTGLITLGGTGNQTLQLGNGAGNKFVNLGSSTGTSTTTILAGSGGLSLGGGTETVAVNSTSWDISSTGVATGFTGITSTNTITAGVFTMTNDTGVLTVGRQNNVTEGGHIALVGSNSGGFDDWNIDVVSNNLRFFTSESTTTNLVEIFNNTSGVADLDVEGYIEAKSGSNTAPSFTFNSDPNTGIYSASADLVQFTAGGSNAVNINNYGVKLIDVTDGHTCDATYVGTLIYDRDAAAEGMMMICRQAAGGAYAWRRYDVTTAGTPDLAEYAWTSDLSLGGGDIVSVTNSDAHRENFYDRFNIIRASSYASKKVLGVVSSDPGIILNKPEFSNTDQEADPHLKPLTLAGRVPVKVVTSTALNQGDRIGLSADFAGIGARLTGSGFSVGTVLTSFDPATASCTNISNPGQATWPNNNKDECYVLPDGRVLAKVLVLVNNEYSLADSSLQEDGSFTLGGTTGTALRVVDELGNQTAGITSQGTATFRSVAAQEMSSRFIAAESLFVTGDATVEGTLRAQSARFDALQASGLTADSASVSGTIYADRLVGNISADSVEGLEARITALVAAQTASQSGTAEPDPETQGDINTLGNGGSELDPITLPGDLIVQGVLQAEGGIITNALLVDGTSYAKNALNFATETECSQETGCNTFAFQASGIGTLTFLNNLVVMSDGTVTINGDLTVTGKVAATTVETTNLASAGQDLTLDLTGTNTEGGDVLGKFIVNGQAEFQSARFERLALEAQNAVQDSANEDQSEEMSAGSGTATLKSGKSEFKIRTSATQADSLIYLTATSATGNKTLYIKSQGDNEFTVAIDGGTHDADITFNWWVVSR